MLTNTDTVLAPLTGEDAALNAILALAASQVAKVYANGRNTLVQSISADDWAKWDASAEIALAGGGCDIEDDGNDDGDGLPEVVAVSSIVMAAA